jgi:protein TonB
MQGLTTCVTRHPLAAAALLSASLHAAAVAIASACFAPPADDHATMSIDVVWLETVAPSESAHASPSPTAIDHPGADDAGSVATAGTRLPQADPRAASAQARKAERRAIRHASRRQVSEAEPESARLSRGTPADGCRSESIERTAICGNHAESSAAPSHEPTREPENVAQGESNGSMAASVSSVDAAPSGVAGGAPRRASGADVIRRVPPVYPIAARRRGIEGAVLLAVRIDGSGDPQHVAIAKSSGNDMLDAAAQTAVAQWRFRAGDVRTLEVPIRFQLRETGRLRSADAASGGEK